MWIICTCSLQPVCLWLIMWACMYSCLVMNVTTANSAVLSHVIVQIANSMRFTVIISYVIFVTVPICGLFSHL